jgi:hypothetical protein
MLALTAPAPLPPPAGCARSGEVFVSRGPAGNFDDFVRRLDRVDREDRRCHGTRTFQLGSAYYLYPTGPFRRWDPAYDQALGSLILDAHNRRLGGATATLSWLSFRHNADFCHFWVADATDAALDTAVAACWRAMGAPNAAGR